MGSIIMPIVPDDFLQSARSLSVPQNSNETDWRNSISRSYYSAFHAAKEKIQYAQGQVKHRGSHNDIIEKFEYHPGGNQQDISIQEIGKLTKICKKL